MTWFELDTIQEVRIIGVGFIIILYIGDIYIFWYPCLPELVFPMDISDELYLLLDVRVSLNWSFLCIFPVDVPNKSFRVPLNGSLYHIYYGTYSVTITVCVLIRSTIVWVFLIPITTFTYFLTLVCFAWLHFFVLPCFPSLGSFWIITIMMISINLMKIYHWFGLVRKSPVVSPMGHHSTDF